MKLFLLVVLNLFTLALSAQPQLPPFKRFPTLPPLELQTPDNKNLTKADLKKKPTLIMYFSPTCDHCIRQTKDMQKRMKDLSKIQIIMATYQPLEELQAFVKEYELSRYSNIRTGRDVKYLLPPFFAMNSLPYFALYTSNGALITTFESNTKVDKILEAFQTDK
ncbi:MAG: hypothetical protein RL732_521 [Bacteroidota bacterium]|jgi:thioredoxin-related protein